MLGATVVFVVAVWFVPFVLAIFSAFASASYQNIAEMIERLKQSMFKSNKTLPTLLDCYKEVTIQAKKIEMHTIHQRLRSFWWQL